MKTCPTCKLSYPSSSLFCTVDGARLEEAGVLTVGTIVRGKYRILAKVGEGGMGEVYKALHTGFDEPRALKMMGSDLMKDPLLVERFKHEAFIARKLQHPNVVRVDDIDEAEDGRPFIVMEFIEGQSLKTVIETLGHLPVPRVCAIVKQVAEALDAAHRLGMIHRDIKPDNIALIGANKGGLLRGSQTAPAETAKVLDFGIAKLKEAREGKLTSVTLTGAGMVVGTAQYMSPEQAAGKRGDELDGRSDVYSLGVVMYQMLTGALPFKAKTAIEMVMAHMQTPPTPIHSIRPDLAIPEPIAALVMRCLEKDPAGRPASAGALAEEIERWEGQTAAVPRSAGAAPQAAKKPGPTPAAIPRPQAGPPAAPSKAASPAPGQTPPAKAPPAPRPATPPPAAASSMPTVALPRPKPDVSAAASVAPPIVAIPSPKPRVSVRAAALVAGPLVAVLAIAGLYYHFAGARKGARPSSTQATSAPAPGSSAASVAPATQSVSPPTSATPANQLAAEPPKPAESDAERMQAEKAAQQAAAAKKAQEQARKRKQALDANLQQFNSLKNQRKYDEARALVTPIGQLGGDTEGLKADLASAASVEFRDLQAKRSDANQRKDIQALQNLAKSYEDLARRDSGDPAWSNRTRDVAENQIPEEIRALTPRAPTESPKAEATKATKQPDISLMTVAHYPLTMPFSSNQVYQQYFLDPGFRVLSKPDLSNVAAPNGLVVTLTLEISPEGQPVKLTKCLSSPAALCQTVADAPGWRFSNPTVNKKPARAIVGLTVRF
jgi:serine/threonine-protein kinase